MADRGPRLSPNVAAVVVLALLAGVLLLWQRPWESSGPSARPVLPDDVASRLTAQLRTLQDAGSEKAFVDATGSLPEAEVFGRRTWSSLQALDVTDLEIRYITGGDVADRPDGSAQAVAEVSWRPGRSSGLGTAVHRSSVRLRVAPQGDGGLAIVGAAPRSGTLPLWLVGAVDVERDGGTSVVTVDGGDGRFPLTEMGAAARSAVRRVVPTADGGLTVVAPRTQAQAAAVLGQPADAIAAIAGVSTQLDDRGQDGATDVIVLNPEVFATQDRRAAQVVLTHEATHVLTGAVGTRASTWVVEGFADFVALRDDTEPLSVSAGQVLAQVREGDLPRRLPDSAEFSSAGRGLGAVYESTWLVFRLLGERYAERDVVRFYEAVLGGRSVDRALTSSFGLTEDRLTAQWRAYLTKSASTVS